MNKNINLKNAFFHGVGGNEISFLMYPKSALTISLLRIEDILKSNGIHSREKQKELNIGHPEFGYHIGFADVDATNNFVSICKKIDNSSETAFEEFIEGKIAIALSQDIAERYDFRNKEQYGPDIGEEQILDSIDISEFIAIVIDVKDEPYKSLATNAISKLLKKYNYNNIPITNIDGEKIIDDLRLRDEEEWGK